MKPGISYLLRLWCNWIRHNRNKDSKTERKSKILYSHENQVVIIEEPRVRTNSIEKKRYILGSVHEM